MQNKKIIICDDDEGILDMLEMILEDEGYETVCVSASLNLHSVIKNENADLILLDLWMPMLSGDQILKTIRQSEIEKELPVIIISASRDGEAIARTSGASDFIAKPFDIDLLLACIGSYLKQNDRVA